MGYCRIVVRLYDTYTLKDKRRITQSVLSRIRNKFNVSASEIEHLDSKEYFGFGCSMISNSRRIIDSTMNKILSYVERERMLEVVEYEQSYL